MDTTGAAGAAGLTRAADAAGPDGGLADALRQHAAARFSGPLRVTGDPGGIIFLAEGGICGCQTPGAPGLEAILLRSRRVTEADWEAAFSAAAVNGRPMAAELIARELLGAGEAEALLRTALADAIFAVLGGRVDGWTEAPAADCLLPLTPPARPGWLLAEATRRSQALAALAGPPVSPRDRVTARPATLRASTAHASGPGAGTGEADVLALCNGRRTVRDLAFALGRGLYATQLELARMRDRGLVAIGSYGADSVSPDGLSGIPSKVGDSDQTSAGLPRRHADRPAAQRPGTASRRYLAAGIQLLRPRSAGSGAPGGNHDPSP